MAEPVLHGYLTGQHGVVEPGDTVVGTAGIVPQVGTGGGKLRAGLSVKGGEGRERGQGQEQDHKQGNESTGNAVPGPAREGPAGQAMLRPAVDGPAGLGSAGAGSVE